VSVAAVVAQLQAADEAATPSPSDTMARHASELLRDRMLRHGLKHRCPVLALSYAQVRDAARQFGLLPAPAYPDRPSHSGGPLNPGAATVRSAGVFSGSGI
jgi:hypothetical protein